MPATKRALVRRRDRRERSAEGGSRGRRARMAKAAIDHPYAIAPILFVLLDPAGLILDVNAAGCRMLCRTRGRLLGTPFRQWVIEDRRRPFIEHFRRARHAAGVVESELQLRVPPGVITARVYTRRVLDGGGIRYPTIAIDVSEYASLARARDMAEDERDRAEQEREIARAANVAKDRLIAMVSHELRNPLSPALVAAESLALMADLPAVARQLAGIVKRNIQLESRLIDDLLDLSRVTRGQLQLTLIPTDVHDVIVEAVNASAVAAMNRGVAIVLNLGAEHHHVAADAARLRQVFWNLLQNAIKFSERDTTVSVKTMGDGPGRIRVAVIDRGAGMDAETRATLFQPFERRVPRSGSRGGLGIGLTICQGIIAGHGGRIAAKSEGLGLGSSFEVGLPTMELQPPDAAAAGAPAGEEDRERRTRRVLLVEDHPDTGSTLSAFLKSHGFDVTLARNLASGLRALAQAWDVVISDIGLGDGSGLEIARRARQLERPPRALIAVSGFGTPQDIGASLDAGFQQHLVKPVDLGRLLALAGG